jgi:hypothetical protein
MTDLYKDKDYQKKYRQTHAEYFINYYKEHKDKLNKEALQPVTCSCGFISGKCNLVRHQKTKLHFKRLNKL